MTRSPDFIIMGAMKCATTTLHVQFGRQPGIFMTELKEPNFFSDASEWNKGIDFYWSHFEAGKDAELCGESSTHYTKLSEYPLALSRMREHLPDVKLIYVMRHPIDRLVSHYIHDWTEGDISCSLEQAIDSHAPLINVGRYAHQLAPYLETYGKEQILPVFFDRLRLHPQQEFERICQFVGYERTPTWSDIGVQHQSAFRARRSPVYRLLFESSVAQRLWKQLDWKVRGPLQKRLRKAWSIPDRPSVPQQQRAMLERFYDADLKQLGSWLGLELTCANFTELTRDTPREWT